MEAELTSHEVKKAREFHKSEAAKEGSIQNLTAPGEHGPNENLPMHRINKSNHVLMETFF